MNASLRTMLPAEIRSSNVIDVSTPMSNNPMIYVDASGNPTGATYDVAAAMGKELGVTFKFTELAFPGVIPGLQSQSFDVSMGVLGDTQARQSILDFVDLLRNDSAIMVQAADAKKYDGLDTLCGKAVGTLAGALQIQTIQAASDSCVSKGKAAIDIKQYTTIGDGYAQVQAGRIAGYLGPYTSLGAAAKTAGGGETFVVTKARYKSDPFAIGMTKGRGTLAKALQGALLALVKDGEYKKILTKYGIGDAALTEDQVLVNGAGTAPFTD